MLATLMEAPARIKRGWDRTLADARGYRFDGEQEAHADQLRQTQISLSLMESADPNEPTQTIMASDIENDAEDRLTVLLGKPRLTLEEKRERDAIQAAIARRRQSFGASPVLVQREAPTPALGFLGPMAGPLGPILMSPVTWVALAFALPATWGGIQTARLNHAKGDLREVREDLAAAIEQRDGWKERAELYADAVTDARETARQSAEALEQERRRRAVAARRERERQRAIQDVLTGSPDAPTWRLRDDQPVQE